jgi:hypothetical protein
MDQDRWIFERINRHTEERDRARRAAFWRRLRPSRRSMALVAGTGSMAAVALLGAVAFGILPPSSERTSPAVTVATPKNAPASTRTEQPLPRNDGLPIRYTPQGSQAPRPAPRIRADSRRDLPDAASTAEADDDISRIRKAFGVQAAESSAPLFEFRNTFRPGSEEAQKREYTPITWSAGDRELVSRRLAVLVRGAPGLFARAAAGGPISIYRINLEGVSQAMGAYRRLSINSAAFPRPGYDWLTRIMAHELTLAADPNHNISLNPAWKALVEPRIEKARKLLAQQGLTAVGAASMPLGRTRSQIDAQIRSTTGLPSAYAAHQIWETLAEIASFMVDKHSNYTPPPEIASFVRKHLLDPLPVR